MIELCIKYFALWATVPGIVSALRHKLKLLVFLVCAQMGHFLLQK